MNKLFKTSCSYEKYMSDQITLICEWVLLIILFIYFTFSDKSDFNIFVLGFAAILLFTKIISVILLSSKNKELKPESQKSFKNFFLSNNYIDYKSNQIELLISEYILGIALIIRIIQRIIAFIYSGFLLLDIVTLGLLIFIIILEGTKAISIDYLTKKHASVN